MQNVIKELFVKTHEKFLSDYVPPMTKPRNVSSIMIPHLQLVWMFLIV